MWIDTHCHLDDPSLLSNIESHLAQATDAQVNKLVIPAVSPQFFGRVVDLADRYPSCFFALGIHPLYIEPLDDDALIELDQALAYYQHHPKLVAIGEIGLDFFVPQFAAGPLRDKQVYFYEQQLKRAKQWNLPVILHARKSHDQLLKYLRKYPTLTGICHAFNASLQQAQAFIDQGFMLGFGGAMTYSRALQIRRLATQLPLHSLVLETDAPDIPPEWLASKALNTPKETADIGKVLAELREVSVSDLSTQILQNTYQILPKLKP